MPRAASVSATVTDAAGPAVVVSTRIAVFGKPAASFAASSISAASVGIELNTRLAPSIAASAEAAASMPRATARSRRGLLMSKPLTCQPAAASLAAIGRPIRPKPIQPACFPGMLLEGSDARGRDLLVLVRLHARDADRTHAGALDHDRHPALDRRDAGHAQHLGPGLDALLPERGRAARFGRGAALLHRDARIRRRRAVHAYEVQQVPAVVEDRDAHVPVVLPRLCLRGGGDLLAVVQREHRSVLHCRACRICSSALGSSMVVRSPGSRPSASAWMERRSVLPERVLGSSETKCTARGRAIAPSCLSTVCMISSAEVFRLASLRTAKASGIWPLIGSATPTTAHSATFGCMLTASSISRVPRRCPATLITSSVRPRMK